MKKLIFFLFLVLTIGLLSQVKDQPVISDETFFKKVLSDKDVKNLYEASKKFKQLDSLKQLDTCKKVIKKIKK